ncbi:MAG: 1-phosphofructokinase family hexose kinase [Chitinophagaceae bacterium]|nr:MAG: 1-phosphofructokinase family hexose kinase [Chitinophagaceae bacterium]
MIVTLTLNAAIDKSTEVEQLIPEKKMRCAEMLIEAGGGGINVSKAIHELGGESVAVYFSGGVTGHLLSVLLAEKKIIAKPVEIGGSTRENFVVSELSTNKQFRFVMPGPAINETELSSIIKTIDDIPHVSFLICSGSLPPGVSPQYLGALATFASERKIKLVVDTSGASLLAAYEKGVYLLKPNMSELCYLVGKDYLEQAEIEDAAKKVINTGCCKVLVVSMGPSGAMLVTKAGSIRFNAPLVKKQSTVGAGDSMVAGIVWMLDQGRPLTDAVQFGIACGTAASINKGTQLFKKEDAFRFYEWIKSTSSHH